MSDDTEFLRRVTLDTLGHLPSPDEVIAFQMICDGFLEPSVVAELVAGGVAARDAGGDVDERALLQEALGHEGVQQQQCLAQHEVLNRETVSLGRRVLQFRLRYLHVPVAKIVPEKFIGAKQLNFIN